MSLHTGSWSLTSSDTYDTIFFSPTAWTVVLTLRKYAGTVSLIVNDKALAKTLTWDYPGVLTLNEETRTVFLSGVTKLDLLAYGGSTPTVVPANGLYSLDVL